MNVEQIVFLVIIFVVVAGLAALGWMSFAATPLRERLNDTVETPAQPAPASTGWVERAAKVAQPFARLSLPEEGWERSPLRTRFMNAGWRNSAVPALYFAAKTVLALAIPLLMALGAATLLESAPRRAALLLLLLGASAGYYLPNLVLSRRVAWRQREIFENFPDALDLLTVCVEAGLSLERALSKVAGEIHIKSLSLAQELQLVLMEMRSGFSKERALRNLALRSGVEDVDTLVAMLIQSERFGTSMGDALRVHSDNLRTKRSLGAEEAAAKVALKLLFPLIFCIFPTLMLVLLGPAALQVVHLLLPTIASAK